MPNHRLHLLRRRRALVSGAAALALIPGCSDAPGDGPVDDSGNDRAVMDVTALPSPAAEGTGEPFLSTSGDGALLSWLAEEGDGSWSLRMARLGPDGWTEPSVVASDRSFFVNWADFPSVRDVGGVLVAHWLERGGSGGYDYGVRIVRSTDGGRTWSEPWTPHEDGTPTEHGFVSVFPTPTGAGVVWLDGRQFARGEAHSAANEMTLRFRGFDPGADAWPEGAAAETSTLVDGRTCDCCQTDVAVATEGPVLVYRDRGPDEVRDIHVTRLVDGEWTEPRPVHGDGWVIPACPVNGPAADARGDTVAVAWFTAALDTPRVRAAFSLDGGETFSAPIEVDDGAPGGRVDLVLLGGGQALVSWLERSGESGGEVRVRRVGVDGRTSPATAVAASSAARSSGFPRMVALPDGSLVFAWTDVGGDRPRVRTATARLGTEGSDR